MNGKYDNAIAGPSTIRTTYSVSAPTGVSPATIHPHAAMNSSHPSSAVPLLYLPPPARPPPKQHLASTQDLISRLQLLPAYDKYVRPPLGSADVSSTTNTNADENVNANTPNSNAFIPNLTDKGKGREMPFSGGDVEMHDANDGDEDDAGGKGEKKKKNGYKHLIKGIPGKHSTRKDDYLEKIMLVPPKQRMKIRRFDEKTQEDAFAISLEGLKGWNINTLVVESAQAREDRKKRKEAKRAAKLQAQLGQLQPSGTGPISPTVSSTSIVQPQPLQAATRPIGASKPGVETPRPGSNTTARPIAVVSRPESAVPKPGTPNQGQVGTPVITRRGTPMEVDQHRGKKREREESTIVNGAHVNGGVLPVGVNGHPNGNSNGLSTGLAQQKQQVAAALNAKAGTGNVRPRPIKKQRMDVQGQARDVTAPAVQQQPTPQGV